MRPLRLSVPSINRPHLNGPARRDLEIPRACLRLLAVLLSGAWLLPTLGFEVGVTEKSVIEFADERRGAEELRVIDAFIQSLSPFDRAARKQTDQPVSQGQFLRFISTQTLAWKPEELERLTSVVGSISNKFAPFSLNFPEKILFVKTTGQEEGNAAYCRSTNLVVLPRDKLNAPAPQLERMLIHELFHLLSRNNPKLRDSLYGIVGYQPCAALDLPESLRPRKITNPDAPRVSHYIEVSVGDKRVPVVPILFSNQANYDVASGKSFFAYLTFRLLAIERAGDGWRPALVENKPWLLEISDVAGFHEQIGRNTGYIIHPEEVLADNFVLLINGPRDVPSPEIIDRMRKVLARARSE